MTVRKIQIADDERVETGPVQFNDDWPGVFIRGDNAAHYKMALEHILSQSDKLSPDDWIFVDVLEGLVKVLESPILK